jgi:acetyl-CoA decarbonylase/synthase complex subunit gamma
MSRLAKKRLSPLDIQRLLPLTNCKECGEENCMAFATKLANREAALNQCAPILQAKYKEQFEKLWEMLKPPVREVSLGGDDRQLKIGGKYVLYRHEFTYYNPTVIAIDVTDELPEAALLERIKNVENFSYRYIGQDLKLDALAIRCVSGDQNNFSKTTRSVVANTNMPLVLCSTNPEVAEAGLAAASKGRPLIYAANATNWKDMAELSIMYQSPLVASAPEGLNELRSLVRTLLEYGVHDLVLDPGTFSGEALGRTLTNFSTIRLAACKNDDQLFGFPIMGIPMTAWMSHNELPEVTRWQEACLASSLMTRYADILVMHSLDGWVLLPNLILRQNLYTDPRKPVAVEPGVRAFGKPDGNSPVLLTTNFALTYYTVAADIESFGLNCYLMVVDAEGLSIESAVAGRKLTADKVSQTLEQMKMAQNVNHKDLIIPGRAARLSGELEELSGWRVLVGPLDSSGIQRFIHEKWNQKPS